MQLAGRLFSRRFGVAATSARSFPISSDRAWPLRKRAPNFSWPSPWCRCRRPQALPRVWPRQRNRRTPSLPKIGPFLAQRSTPASDEAARQRYQNGERDARAIGPCSELEKRLVATRFGFGCDPRFSHRPTRNANMALLLARRPRAPRWRRLEDPHLRAGRPTGFCAGMATRRLRRQSTQPARLKSAVGR